MLTLCRSRALHAWDGRLLELAHGTASWWILVTGAWGGCVIEARLMEVLH